MIEVRFFLSKRLQTAAKTKKAAVPFIEVVALVACVVAFRLAPPEEAVERVFFEGGDGLQQFHRGRHHAVGILHERCTARFDFGGSLQDHEELVGAILENGALFQNGFFFGREGICVEETSERFAT